MSQQPHKTEAERFSERLNLAFDASGRPVRGRGVWLAKTFKVKQPTAHAWLRGKHMPEAERIEKIATALKVNFMWLWLEEGLMTGFTEQEEAWAEVASHCPAAGVSDDVAVYRSAPEAPTTARLAAEIDALQLVIGIMAVNLVQNVPDAIERVAEGIRRNGLGSQKGFLRELERQIGRALAQRRESLGPQRGESTQTPGAARRRP